MFPDLDTPYDTDGGVSRPYWPVRPAFLASLRQIKEKKGGRGAPKQLINFLLAFSIFSNENQIDFLPFFFNLKKKFLEANRHPKSPSFPIRNHLLHSFLTLSLAREASYRSSKEIVCGFHEQISFLFGEQIYFMFA
jgi:hypothetical protein